MPITDLTLPQLVAALSLGRFACRLVDRAPAHRLPSSRARAVGLYSDAFYQHPRRWGPIGPAASVLIARWTHDEPPLIRSPLGPQHMAQISVEMVVERMRRPVAERSAA